MVRTVEYGNLNVNYRVASDNAVCNLFLNTLVNCRDVFLRNNTTNNFVNEFVTLTSFERFETEPTVTVLTTTTRLTFE